MKRWMKGMLAAAVVCMAAGTAVCGVAWAMGGRFSHYRARNYGITVKADDRIKADEDNMEGPGKPVWQTEAYGEEVREHHEIGSEGETMRQAEKSFGGRLSVNGHEIMELDIEVAGVYVEVVPDDMADTIIITGDEELYRYDQEIDDDTFKISVRRRKNVNKSFPDLDDFEMPGVEIRIPSGCEFKDVELEVEGGALLVHEITAGILEMDLSAGLLEVASGRAWEVNGDCKAGELIYRGAVEGQIEAECSTGVITYELDGKEEDFSYELEKEMGSIVISGIERGRNNKDTVIDNPGAAKRADLECKVGEINVSFR